MDELEIIRERKGKQLQKVHVKENKIFYTPDLENDDIFIFWVWHRRLTPAFAARTTPKPLIVMNLWGIRTFKARDEEFKGLFHYISAVMLEELTHCFTSELAGHRKWIKKFIKLQEELE